MSCPQIHVDDTGTVLVFTLKDQDGAVMTNLASYDSHSIKIKKPDKTTTTVTASLYTDGTDGKISYTVTSGLFSDSGYYSFQVISVDGSTTKHSNIITKQVYANL